MLHEIENEFDFNDRIATAGSNLTIVYFHVAWSGPCKSAEPKLKQLIEDTNDRVQILKIDIEKLSDLKKKFNVKYVPTFIFFWHGRKLDGVVDEADVKKVQKYVDKYLKNKRAGSLSFIQEQE